MKILLVITILAISEFAYSQIHSNKLIDFDVPSDYKGVTGYNIYRLSAGGQRTLARQAIINNKLLFQIKDFDENGKLYSVKDYYYNDTFITRIKLRYISFKDNWDHYYKYNNKQKLTNETLIHNSDTVLERRYISEADSIVMFSVYKSDEHTGSEKQVKYFVDNVLMRSLVTQYPNNLTVERNFIYNENGILKKSIETRNGNQYSEEYFYNNSGKLDSILYQLNNNLNKSCIYKYKPKEIQSECYTHADNIHLIIEMEIKKFDFNNNLTFESISNFSNTSDSDPKRLSKGHKINKFYYQNRLVRVEYVIDGKLTEVFVMEYKH